MPLYTFLVAFRVEPHLGFFMPKEAQWYNHLVVAVMTGVFPLLGALILRRGHRMDDVVLNDRAARISPMMGTLIYYCVAYWLLRKYPTSPQRSACSWAWASRWWPPSSQRSGGR